MESQAPRSCACRPPRPRAGLDRRTFLLRHPSRRRITQALQDCPGSGLRHLSRQADLPESTVRHHLQVLVTEGLVMRLQDRSRPCFFLRPDSGPLDALWALWLRRLHQDRYRRVLVCFGKRRTWGFTELHRRLTGSSASSARRLLDQLVRDGFLATEKVAGARLYALVMDLDMEALRRASASS